MTALQKVLMAIVGIAGVTTLILPGRQTAQVMKATGDATRGVLGTAMGATSSGNRFA